MDQLPRLGKRELICLLSFTCNYVVFVWRGFLFLWVLGMGYVILLWHSLSLPYNYLAPEDETHNVSEIHSNVSSEDMRFQNLIEEVFKLFLADKFPKKTDEVFGREQAEIFHSNGMLKATKKSISLPQSKCPLIKTIDCIIQSLGAVEVEWFLFYASTIAQDWLFSRADINKLVKFKYYQAHN